MMRVQWRPVPDLQRDCGFSATREDIAARDGGCGESTRGRKHLPYTNERQASEAGLSLPTFPNLRASDILTASTV